jgi:hypothetical protein
MGKEFKKKRKSFAGRFPPRRPAATAPRPISACEPDLPPVTAPPTLTAGTHLSGPSSPQILPCSTLACRHWRVPHRSVVHASIPSRHSAATCVPTPWSRRIAAHAAWRLVDAVVCAPPCFSLRRQDAGANRSTTRPSSSPLHWPSCQCRKCTV